MKKKNKELCPLNLLNVPLDQKVETAAFLSFIEKIPLSRFSSLTPKEFKAAEDRILKQIFLNFIRKLLKTKSHHEL